jgi:hypothetical protein
VPLLEFVRPQVNDITNIVIYDCQSWTFLAFCGGRGPGFVPEAPKGLLSRIVSGLDIRRRLFLAFGAVEFQNRVEGDFAHALLDGRFFTSFRMTKRLSYSFSYSRVRSSPTS